MNEENARRSLEESMRKWESHEQDENNFEKLMLQFKDHLFDNFINRYKKYFS